MKAVAVPGIYQIIPIRCSQCCFFLFVCFLPASQWYRQDPETGHPAPLHQLAWLWSSLLADRHAKVPQKGQGSEPTLLWAYCGPLQVLECWAKLSLLNCHYFAMMGFCCFDWEALIIALITQFVSMEHLCVHCKTNCGWKDFVWPWQQAQTPLCFTAAVYRDASVSWGFWFIYSGVRFVFCVPAALALGGQEPSS